MRWRTQKWRRKKPSNYYVDKGIQCVWLLRLYNRLFIVLIGVDEVNLIKLSVHAISKVSDFTKLKRQLESLSFKKFWEHFRKWKNIWENCSPVNRDVSKDINVMFLKGYKVISFMTLVRVFIHKLCNDFKKWMQHCLLFASINIELVQVDSKDF